MNAKHFQRINPHFKFNRVFLYNQIKFNSQGNMKKFLYPLNKPYPNNKFITELNEEKNLDYLTQNLISENKNIKDSTKTSKDKNMTVREIRAKLVKNNNLLKLIDFNINNINYINNSPKEKSDNLELNINNYQISSPRINNKNKRTINLLENKNIAKNELNTKSKKNDYLKNKSYDGIKTVFDSLKLPFISKNINKKSYNILSLNKNNENKKIINDSNDDNKSNFRMNTNNEAKADESENKRDIFKNITYFIDNKKTKLKVNDIERNIYNMKSLSDNDNEEEVNPNFESKIFINTKIPKSVDKDTLKKKDIDTNFITDENLLEDEKMIKIKEKEKYIIYEQNKKFIEKKKIYNAMKYGAASIPNLILDKGFRDVKKFEHDVLNMKKTQVDLPLFIQTKHIN